MTIPPTEATGAAQGPDTLSGLLREAIDRSNLEVGSHDPELEEAMRGSNAASTMMDVVGKRAGGFREFREHGARIRAVLKPITTVVSLFIDGGSDAAAVS